MRNAALIAAGLILAWPYPAYCPNRDAEERARLAEDRLLSDHSANGAKSWIAWLKDRRGEPAAIARVGETLASIYRTDTIPVDQGPWRLDLCQWLWRAAFSEPLSFLVARLALARDPAAGIRLRAARHLARLDPEGSAFSEAELWRAAESDPDIAVRRRAIYSAAHRAANAADPGPALTQLIHLAGPSHALYLETTLVKSLALIAQTHPSARQLLTELARGEHGASPKVALVASQVLEKGVCPIETAED